MFFSVKTPTKIAGKVYTPCVCYSLPDILKPTIEKMVKEEKANIYDNKVFFQNGKVLVKDTKGETFTVQVKEKPKKSKKEKKEDIKEEEDIPSPQEIADDMTAGDF